MRHLTVALVAVTLTPALAVAKEHDGTSVTKTARRGDVASRYLLRNDGHLFREIAGTPCEVTADVAEFKIADNPSDPSAIYLVRKGALYALATPTPDQTKSCPKAELTQLVPAIDSYTVVNRKDTPISLLARDASGKVTAWDAKGPAVWVEGTTQMRLNKCFGTKKSFGSYVAFAIDSNGVVSKIGGKDPRHSKADPKHYASLDAFLAKNKVCR
jgi:hypothetical protein